MNVQVVTDTGGHVLWISPALPGRAHDLTEARTHRIIRICERQGVPMADCAYQGAGPWVTTGFKRPPGGELLPWRRLVPAEPGPSGTYEEDPAPEEADRGGTVTDLSSRPGDQFGI